MRHIHRLREEILRAELHCLHCDLYVVLTRQHDHGRIVLFESFQNTEPGDSRESQV